MQTTTAKLDISGWERSPEIVSTFSFAWSFSFFFASSLVFVVCYAFSSSASPRARRTFRRAHARTRGDKGREISTRDPASHDRDASVASSTLFHRVILFCTVCRFKCIRFLCREQRSDQNSSIHASPPWYRYILYMCVYIRRPWTVLAGPFNHIFFALL